MEKIKEKELLEEKVEDVIDDNDAELFVLNDDFNTFEKVTKCLMEYCNLDLNLAYVCTLIIHHYGECCVLRDKKSVLHPICENIIESGLDAEIRDIKEDKK